MWGSTKLHTHLWFVKNNLSYTYNLQQKHVQDIQTLGGLNGGMTQSEKTVFDLNLIKLSLNSVKLS